MSHWTDVRRAAQTQSASTRRATNGDASAAAVLNAAAVQTGVKSFAVAPTDPLLCDADAVYQASARRIWYSRDLDPESAAVVQAHEYAHHWLGHADDSQCRPADLDAGESEEPIAFGAHRVEGYGPKERRERDANLFAREFLLPTDLLRRWVIDDGLTASAIAERVGVPLPIVLHQLAYALLVGDLPRLTPEIGTGPDATLDPTQRAAATVDHGPVLIEAGPGTGKTRTLVARIVELISRGIAPESILVLTFSNRAAAELHERVARADPHAAMRLWLGTFHGFGLELLRKYGPTHLGLPQDPSVLDPVDAVFLLERELPALALDYYQFLPEPTQYLKPLLNAISRAKDELAAPADYALAAHSMAATATSPAEQEAAARATEVARVYAVYQRCLETRGLVDFGDLIARSVALLRDDGNGIRRAVRAQYSHILVDEYQDVNRASAHMLRELAGEGQGLWVVGDARQSIYRFRGAAPANMVRFTADFPGARMFALGHNYRSQPAIVRAVSAFAAGMPPGAIPFAPWQVQRPDTGGGVRLEIADTPESEADGIAQAAIDAQARGRPFRDQAVLCRSHAQLARVADRLEQAGVPIVYLGDVFERPEIRDLLSVLSFVDRPRGSALVRVRGFPEYATASDAGAVLPSQLDGLLHGHEAWTVLAYFLFDRSQYLRPLLLTDSVAARTQRLAIYQFLQFAYGQRERTHVGHRTDGGGRPVRTFLRLVRRIAMLSEDTPLRQLPEWAADLDGVRCLTVHGAKGLEFPVVYVPALATTQFPASTGWTPCPLPSVLSRDVTNSKADHDQEEECLFFVALSRARDTLVLSRALKHGKVSRGASPFLVRLRSVLPEVESAPIVSWAASTRPPASTTRTDVAPARPPLPVYMEPALHTYMQCPRRYYYEEILHLPRARADASYLVLHRVVHRVLDWVRNERAAGRAPTDADIALRLAEQWATDGPRGHPYEALYREVADALVAKGSVPPPAGVTASRPEWTVTLENGSVTVVPSALEIGPGGRTVLARRIRTGRPTLDETDKPIYALLLTAARAHYPQSECSVEVTFLATGTTQSLSVKPSTIATRTAKYSRAITGIQAGDFAPEPSQYGCPRCAHYFICPAGA